MGSAISGIMGGGGGGGLLGGIMGGGQGGGMFGAIGGIAGSIFGGPIGGMLGSAVGNMLDGAMKDSTDGAVDTLAKEDGMPKFLAEEIKKAVAEVVGQSQGQRDVPPGAQAEVENHPDIKQWKDDFIADFTKSLVEAVRKNMEKGGADGAEGEEGGGGKKAGKGGSSGATSWLTAIAKALGEVMGQKAGKLVELSNKMKALSAESTELKGKKGDEAAGEQKANAQAFSEASAEQQGTQQELSMMQNATSSVLKGIGEALSQMMRKG